MATELIAAPAISFAGRCDIRGERNPQAPMTPQALHPRLAPYAVSYVHDVFALALRQQLEAVCERLWLGTLAPLARVLLEDRTPCRLHAKLAEDFQGSGGSASTAA
jgi:hypothetical protein